MHNENTNSAHDSNYFAKNKVEITRQKYALLLAEPETQERILNVVIEGISEVVVLADHGIQVARTDHPLIAKNTLAKTLHDDKHLKAYIDASRHKSGKRVNAERFIQIIDTHPAKFSMPYAFVTLFVKEDITTPEGCLVYDYCMENVGACVSLKPIPDYWSERERLGILKSVTIHVMGHLMGLAPPQSPDCDSLAHCWNRCIMQQADGNPINWRRLNCERLGANVPFCPECAQHLRTGEYFLR